MVGETESGGCEVGQCYAYMAPAVSVVDLGCLHSPARRSVIDST